MEAETTGPVQIREYPVHPALAPYVKCLWSLESAGPILDPPRERILPDTCVELVFHFHDPFLSHFADGGAARQPRSFVVGQMTRFLEIQPAGRAGFIAVRFLARGAYLFFRRPLREVAGGVVDLADLGEPRADEWTQRVVEARSMEMRLRAIESALLSLLGGARTEPAVDRALQIVEARQGQVRVEALAAEIGVSCRHLTRLFERAVGVTPKRFGRITRFVHALRLLDGPGRRSLTDVALQCGYCDQAHFDHEFRELAGMSPRDLAGFPGVSF